MKIIVINDLKRMVGNRYFWISLLLGCVIAGWHFFQYVYGGTLEEGLPQNLYVSWMGSSSFYIQSYWYFLIFPLFAVLPFVECFYDDLSSGLLSQALVRSSRKTYFWGKGISIFCSGGIGVAVPLLFNFCLTAMCRPALFPDPFTEIGPLTGQIGSGFYYEHPLVYMLLYLVIDFITGGMIALGAAAMSYVVNYKFVALLLPVGLHFFLFCIGNMFQTNVYSPNYFLIPGMGMEKIQSIGMLLVYFVFAAGVFWYKGYHYER